MAMLRHWQKANFTAVIPNYMGSMPTNAANDRMRAKPAYTLCLKKNRTPATFYNNSNSPGSIAIDFDTNNL